MDLQIAGKTVFITGASGGIGRALASVFGAEGARLLLHTHRREAELREWVAGQPWSADAMVVRADVRSPDEVDAAVAAGSERWGRIDACVANAGIWPTADEPLHTLPVERVRDVIAVNLLGAAWTARAFMGALAAAGPRDDGHGSALVFIGSTAGRFGERGHADYAMSKAGLTGLVRTLKNEIVALDPRGRVNMIEPGWTVTHMARPALDVPGNVERAVTTMPLRQVGRAADIAATALYLVSPALARHTTGQVVTVAGGMEGRVLWDPAEIDGDAIRSAARDEDPA